MALDDAELITMFVTESREHLEHFEADILALEEQCGEIDPDLPHRIFRAMHSIKGGAAVCGLPAVKTLSHAMENVMALVRDGLRTPDRSVIDVLLAAGDKLLAMIDDVRHSDSIDVHENLADLESVLANTSSDATPSAPAMTPGPDAEPLPYAADAEVAAGPFLLPRRHVADAAAHGRFVYAATAFTRTDIHAKDLTPLDYVQQIESIGTLMASRLDIDAVTGLDGCPGQDLPFHFVVATVLDPRVVGAGLGLPSDQIEPVPTHDAGAVAAARPAERRMAGPDAPVSAAPSSVATAEETIRVPVSLLDTLMDLTGEMVLSRNQLLRLTTKLADDVHDLPRVLQNINLVTNEVQDAVLRTRMQPVGTVLSKFHRVVRDLCRTLGKEVNFEISGEDVELDKSIVEQLSDPLTHLVRNSLDHGIEDPDERERQGKSRTGCIRLRAEHEGGQVLVHIEDDGQGMDPAKLINHAVERDVLTHEAASTLTDREAFTLIFRPGFSMAAGISDISGRGVGMDVVRTNIEELGGHVDIRSVVGEGTRITMRLPLTLAIIPALIVQTAGRRFAIPQSDLAEVVRPDEKTPLQCVRGMDVLRLRGELLRTINLGTVLGIPGSDATGQRYVLVLKAHGHRYGLAVDALMDNEDVVVKPLGAYLRGSRCYSGATVMGDGTLAMILTVPGLADYAGFTFGEDEDAEGSAVSQDAATTSETSSLLLFRNGTDERFAIHIEQISRVERVRAEDLERIGNRNFVTSGETALPVLRLHDHLPVAKPTADGDTFHMIVPRTGPHPTGILASRVEDIVDVHVVPDSDSMRCPGVLGTTVINGHLTILLDVYGLQEQADPGIHGHSAAETVLKGKRVLLAEDTEFLRTLESEYLNAFGCVVDVVCDGLSAWEHLSKNQYDVVLTDTEMPGLNGVELAERIRGSEALRQLPVIMLSALAAKRLVEKEQNIDVDVCDAKLDKERLREALAHVLAGGLDRPPNSQHAVSRDQGQTS